MIDHILDSCITFLSNFKDSFIHIFFSYTIFFILILFAFKSSSVLYLFFLLFMFIGIYNIIDITNFFSTLYFEDFYLNSIKNYYIKPESNKDLKNYFYSDLEISNIKNLEAKKYLHKIFLIFFSFCFTIKILDHWF